MDKQVRYSTDIESFTGIGTEVLIDDKGNVLEVFVDGNCEASAADWARFMVVAAALAAFGIGAL